MTKTNHAPLRAGQNVFQCLAYSKEDVLKVASEIDTEDFINNPVLLQEHDHKNPVGQVLQFKWTKDGLLTQHAFDTESEAGIEAQRKWMRGLRSSLSVGLSGKKDDLGKWNWRLSELSVVTVPLDPKATAKIDERMPIQIASLPMGSEENEGDEEEMTVYLIASAASDEEREPIHLDDSSQDGTVESEPSLEDETKQAQDDSANLEQTVTPMSDTNTNDEYRDDLIEELKAGNQLLREREEEHKTEKAALQETIEELQTQVASLLEKQEELEGKLQASEAKMEKQSSSEDEMIKISDDLYQREAALKEEKEELEKREARVKVQMEVARWNHLLPKGCDGEGMTVRQVLEAAAPAGLIATGKSDDELRGHLEEITKQRFHKRLEASSRKHVPITSHSGTYIPPDKIHQYVTS